MGEATKRAVAIGYFDGVHAGHKAVIARAAEKALQNGFTAAVFTFGGAPRLPKFGTNGGMCITSFDDRVSLMREVGAQYVFAPPFDAVRGLAPREFFENVLVGEMNAGFICCGEDFRFGKDGIGSASLLGEMCAQAGVGFAAVPPVCIDSVPVSSTIIREYIAEGNIPKVNRLLGRELFYTLPVIGGRKLGRTIGFPTINQVIPSVMVRPRRGVYISRTELDGKLYPSVTNIGVKPTVQSNGDEITETHIIGFSGDLYGKTVRVRLCSFMRDEQKFPGLDELKAQLEEDCNKAISAFS